MKKFITCPSNMGAEVTFDLATVSMYHETVKNERAEAGCNLFSSDRSYIGQFNPNMIDQLSQEIPKLGHHILFGHVFFDPDQNRKIDLGQILRPTVPFEVYLILEHLSSFAVFGEDKGKEFGGEFCTCVFFDIAEEYKAYVFLNPENLAKLLDFVAKNS